MSESDTKSWTRYLPVIVAALIAIVGIVMASVNFSSDETEDWERLVTEVKKLEAAAAQAEEIAVRDQKYVECVATKATHALVSSAVGGLESARDGFCKIPAADVDVTACLVWSPAVAEGTDVPALVELSVASVLPLVPAVVGSTDAPENAKAWVKAVSGYLDSARPTVLELVRNPSTGILHVEGVVIEGCTTR